MDTRCSIGLIFVLGTLQFCFVTSSRVLELSDRLLEVRHDGVWLIKFYAPWCGHCKNLEPIWNQVAQSLVDTDIRVGRLDCTRFTSVATEFSVRGFPTILFLKGHKTVEYRGDRIRDDIVDFARRMNGPAVRHFHTCDDMMKARTDYKVFFLYSDGTVQKDSGEVKDNFTRLAEEFQPMNYFFTAPPNCVGKVEGRSSPTKPSIYVFKDNSSYLYDEEIAAEQNMTLQDWMSKERFPTFLKITYGNFNQMLRSGKYIVAAVLEENQIGKLTLRMEEFKDIIEAIALNTRHLYQQNFVFGWIGTPDIANSVAMMTLPLPSLIVIRPDTYQYYLPEAEDGSQPPTSQAVISLLDRILEGTAVPYGGNTFLYRVYRASYEAKTSLTGMWRGNPVLTAVLFGLPLGFLSIICYTTCCSDIMEASEEDEEEEGEESHKKKE